MHRPLPPAPTSQFGEEPSRAQAKECTHGLHEGVIEPAVTINAHLLQNLKTSQADKQNRGSPPEPARIGEREQQTRDGKCAGALGAYRKRCTRPKIEG